MVGGRNHGARRTDTENSVAGAAEGMGAALGGVGGELQNDVHRAAGGVKAEDGGMDLFSKQT